MIPKWEFYLGTRCKGHALLSATFVRTRLMQLIEAGHFMLSRSLLTKDDQSCSRCGVQNTKKSTWRKPAFFCTDSKLTTGRILINSNANETFKQYRKEYLGKKVGSWRQWSRPTVHLRSNTQALEKNELIWLNAKQSDHSQCHEQKSILWKDTIEGWMWCSSRPTGRENKWRRQRKKPVFVHGRRSRRWSAARFLEFYPEFPGILT